MEIEAVKKSYAIWAPFYDRTFGAVTNAGRRRAAAQVNTSGGTLLEVGVGTGLALNYYDPAVQITGIDASAEMLEKAKIRVAQKGFRNVDSLQVMDARELAFADDSFDHVAAMHLMSVVPEPERVLAEIARVCKPGGDVLIVNHFARTSGTLSIVERIAAPMANFLGWHSDFKRDIVMGDRRLRLIEESALPPFGMMSYLRFERLA